MKVDREHPIDVVWLKAGENCKGLEVMTEEIEGIHILTLRLPLKQLSDNGKDEAIAIEPVEKYRKKEDRKKERLKKKIANCIRKYDAENAAIVAVPVVAVLLQMTDILFEVRKWEFLSHMDYIYERMPGEHILLVVGERALSHFWRQELLEVLVAAKDRYREISIYGACNKMLEELIEFLYEEWGVVVHVLRKEELRETCFDAALFLTAYGDRLNCPEVCCKNGYVVMDSVTEQTLCYRRRIAKGQGNIKGGVFGGQNRAGNCKEKNTFAGLAYEKNGRMLPYELASNLAYQKPNLFEEFGISFVAIYGLQCYNRDRSEEGGMLH